MQYPAAVKAKQVYDHPVSSLDIFATIAELAKARINSGKKLDGVNLIPYVTGEKSQAPHAQIFIRKFDQSRYIVRQGDFKLVIPYKGASPQLYNLSTDIGEETNIAALHPERVKALDKLRKDWDSQLIEPKFLGLMQLPSHQKKAARNKINTQKSAKGN